MKSSLRGGWFLLLFTSSLLVSIAAPPAIVQQPISYTVGVGTNVELMVNATGDSPLTCRWRLNGAPLNAATQQVFRITNVSIGVAGTYSVLVSNSFGAVTSQVAYLTVVGNSLPQKIRAVPGARLTLVVPTAGQAVAFSWSKDGTNLPNATNSLSFSNFSLADAGTYSVIVSNEFGSVAPPPAELVASTPGPFDSWRMVGALPDGYWHRIEQANGQYIAVGSYQIASSPDAVTWTSTSVPNKLFYGVGFGNDLYVAAGEISAIYTSSAGQSWVPRQIDAFGQVRAVAYGSTQFVAVAQQEIFTSPDGISWSEQMPARLEALRDVAWGDGIFSITANGNIQSSSNGIDWLETYTVPLGDFLSLARITYGNGRFVAVGSDGYALVSTDGVHWTKQETGTLEWFSGLTFANGYFVAITRSSSIVSSRDGMQWTVHSRGTNQWIEPFNYFPLICAGDSTVLVGAAGNVLFESDPIVDFQMRLAAHPELSINTRTGIVCRVEAKNDLTASWQTLTNIAVLGKPLIWRDPATNWPMKFYRVVR